MLSKCWVWTLGAACLAGCTPDHKVKTQPGGAQVDAPTASEPPGAPPPTATAAATATAKATATALATAVPSGVSSACAACDAKPHMMCSEQTDGACVDVCLPGWAKIGMTHCGKICTKDADCAPDKGKCEAGMATNEGLRVCNEAWMGFGTHTER